MGDENSLAGTTKAHKHTALASDGGFLETTETGVTNMSEGSIAYYDGSEVMQELVKPVTPANEVLTFATSATAPSWVAGSSGTTMTKTSATTNVAQSTSSSSLVSLTTMVMTCQSGSGHALVSYNGTFEADENCAFAFDLSTDTNPNEITFRSSGTYSRAVSIQCVSDSLSSQTIQVKYRVLNPAGTCEASTNSYYQNLQVLEIA
jgi:hypothetical protein